MAMYEPSHKLMTNTASSNANKSTANKPKNDSSSNSSPSHAPLSSSIDISQIITGCKDQGAKQYQEDSLCIFYSPDMTVLVAAIFDGHGGLNGQVASQIVANLTEQYFEQKWQICKLWNNHEWTKQMNKLFVDLHTKVRDSFIEIEMKRRKHQKLPMHRISDNGVVRKSSGFPVHGGTTCTIVTIIRNTKNNKWRIITANTGDSDALLLARKPTRLKDDNNKQKHLSVDHSPDNADEYLRIKHLSTDEYPTKLLFVYDQANTCRKFECPIVFLNDGTKDPKYVKNPWGNHLRPTNVRYDPAVYAVSPYGVSHDITCIAMTRSLGDFYAHQFGLTCIPSVTFNELDIFEHEYIITVGSDGVWDCWKWDDFSDYVNGVMTKHHNNLEIVCKMVLKHTVQRAKACFGEGSYDDASLVCVALRPELFYNQTKMSNSNTNGMNDSNTNGNNNNNDSNHIENNGYQDDAKDEKEELSVKGLDED